MKALLIFAFTVTLLAAATPLYARGDEIVRPIVEEVTGFNGCRTKVVRLKPATADMLRDYLSRSARWEKYSGRQRKFVATDPPLEVVKIILARDGEWRFRRREPIEIARHRLARQVEQERAVPNGPRQHVIDARSA